MVSKGRYCFQMPCTHLETGAKKSEASEALSSWCFFRLNEVAFFSSSLFISSKFFYLRNFSGLVVPQTSI